MSDSNPPKRQSNDGNQENINSNTPPRPAENSELSELDSNLQTNSTDSLLNLKTNIKTNTKTNVSIESKNNQPKGFRFRVEDLKLNKNIKSKSLKLNRSKQNLKSIKSTSVKRNQTRNIKQQPITPKSQRRNVSELIDMMVQLNMNSLPKTTDQSNINDINRRQNRSRTFTFQSNVPYGQFSQFRPAGISSLPTRQQLPSEHQQSTGLSLGNRIESVDLRLLYVFENLINLIDRFINLIDELRINYLDNQNNDILINRIISEENNSDLMDAITFTLPDRLANRISERFSIILAQELEKVFSKYFGDKKR